MAPVYALTIAFVIVFAGGWVIDMAPGFTKKYETPSSQQPTVPAAIPISATASPEQSRINPASATPDYSVTPLPPTGSTANEGRTTVLKAPATAASTRSVSTKAGQ